MDVDDFATIAYFVSSHHFGVLATRSSTVRSQATCMMMWSGTPEPSMRPPWQQRSIGGASGWLSLISATSNSIAGAGGMAAETPGGSGLGWLALSMTVTGRGALPGSSLSPRSLSTNWKRLTPSDPARARTGNGVTATSKSQYPFNPV